MLKLVRQLYAEKDEVAASPAARTFVCPRPTPLALSLFLPELC